MKTLKCEEVYLKTYRDREEVRASIAHFTTTCKRLHSALRPTYQPASFRGGGRAAAFDMSFFRHREIYPSDGGAGFPGQRPRSSSG